MADTSKKEARVTIRVSEGALNTVRTMAEQEDRSISEMLRVLLTEALKARVNGR